MTRDGVFEVSIGYGKIDIVEMRWICGCWQLLLHQLGADGGDHGA